MNVRLRDTVFVGIKHGDDEFTYEALEAARELLETFGPQICISATVDRFDGLALLFELPNSSTWPGWHFNSAICGYPGDGPETSARILAMFGFGTFAEIMGSITNGGNDANFTFAK